MADVTVVIPAYNEADRIGPVVRGLIQRYSVLVVDDGSTDSTASEARIAGARVVEQSRNSGYIDVLEYGFQEVTSDNIVTFDADGEQRPKDIEKLLRPIKEEGLDLVLGSRDRIPRPSERLLNIQIRLEIDVKDSGTGLRALRRSFALDLDTACACGAFVLEAAARGACI